MIAGMASRQEKAERFRALHDGDTFVIPNPWDAGAAKMLAGLGFEALATTSSGFAFTLGRPDGSVDLEEMAAHIAALDEATDLPVAADLENGYGPAPEDAARAISRAGDAGAVGGSIEDWDRDDGRLYGLEEAAARIGAAAEAARAHDFPFTLTARAENFVHGNPDLDDTIARLRAYEDAGADVLFAPGLSAGEQVRAICDAVSKPVNVLATPRFGLSLAELADLGAQRISVGGSLTWTAAGAALEAAERIRRDGDFSALGSPGRIRDFLG